MLFNPQGSANIIAKATILIVLINLICLFVLNNHSPSQDGPRLLQQNPSSSNLRSEQPVRLSRSSPFKFLNPNLAFQILNQLDVFEPVNPSYLGMGSRAIEQYEKPFLGLKNDDEYCIKQRAHFTQNPDMVFGNMSFVMEHGPNSLLRKKAAGAVGVDIMPHVGKQLPTYILEGRTIDLKPDVNLFFTVSGIHRKKHVGKHFACLAQEFNHIPGHYTLNRKDTTAEGAINYAKKFEDRPQCFNFEKYFPKTWLLYNKESCEEFFAEFNSPEYLKLKEERGIVYIKKVAVGSHRGKGVFPITEDQEVILRREYRNGSLCGSNSKLMIVQSYIHKPLLLEGRKFDFRMYMVIASTNPLMVFYHDGFLRVSLYDYDTNTTDKKVLLTNLALNSEVYSDAKQGKLHHGMSEEELKIAQQWSFERLRDYLLKAGVIKDPNWLDNYLRPELKRAMIHLVKMSSHSFLKRSSLYEFYGVDFMLDEDLTLWFIEANSGPALDGYSQPMEKFIVQMLKDHFEIVYNLLRSRMKRVVMLVNRIIEEEDVILKSDGSVEIKDFTYWRKAFEKVSMNYYEPEFLPSPTNGYSKILDENLSGPARFVGLIDAQCA